MRRFSRFVYRLIFIKLKLKFSVSKHKLQTNVNNYEINRPYKQKGGFYT